MAVINRVQLLVLKCIENNITILFYDKPCPIDPGPEMVILEAEMTGCQVIETLENALIRKHIKIDFGSRAAYNMAELQQYYREMVSR